MTQSNRTLSATALYTSMGGDADGDSVCDGVGKTSHCRSLGGITVVSNPFIDTAMGFKVRVWLQTNVMRVVSSRPISLCEFEIGPSNTPPSKRTVLCLYAYRAPPCNATTHRVSSNRKERVSV